MSDSREDKALPPLADRAAPPSERSPSVSGIASIPSAVDAAWDRLHKFAIEWKFMEAKSGYTGTVCELHPGDPRHAKCAIDDIILLLEAVNARTS